MAGNRYDTTIPTIMSTTSDDRIYTSRLFVNKEKLKQTLGLYALKEKFEYRVKRSNKTCFAASYKDIECKFKLCVARDHDDLTGQLGTLLRIIVVNWICIVTFLDKYLLRSLLL